jgi:two-component system response regulator FlrC
MIRIMNMARKIAHGRSTVLINGETGVGKEVMARFIHSNSDRKDAPFVAVNCAALPESLLESELFGHEKGAFTGAISRKKGKFELADGGTLLLDEISEMDVSIQAKLLRVLQEREIDRVGGQGAISIDTRVIATTNRDLEAETKNGNFRLDLYYRLNVVPIKLPPLRERPDDIAPLAEFFLKKHCTLNNTPVKAISPDAEAFLKRRTWPGNVREFENLLERATLLVESDMITSEDLESISSPDSQVRMEAVNDYNLIPLREMEKMMIMKALDNHKGNRTHAANILGISVRTLRNKLHEYETGYSDEEPSND